MARMSEINEVKVHPMMTTWIHLINETAWKCLDICPRLLGEKKMIKKQAPCFSRGVLILFLRLICCY